MHARNRSILSIGLLTLCLLFLTGCGSTPEQGRNAGLWPYLPNLPELKIPPEKAPIVRKWATEDPAMFSEIQTRYRERDAAIKAYNARVHAHNAEVLRNSGLDPDTIRQFLARE